MSCPCCHGALARPPAFLRVTEGARYCARCQWVLAQEILEGKTGLTGRGAALKCPTHGDAQVGDLTVLEVQEFDERFRAAIVSFPPELRPELVRILDLPDDERAADLGTLFHDGRLWPLAELLIDLEDEPALRKLTTAELREMANRDRRA
jgi:hypothetical protein